MKKQRNIRQICEQCSRWYWMEEKGRPSKYCSNACKQKAYRRRVAYAKMDANRQWLIERLKRQETQETNQPIKEK